MKMYQMLRNRPVFELDIEWMQHAPQYLHAGSTIPWVKELSYLGVHILQSRAHYQITEKHFIARQMLYVERLVASHPRR